MITASDLRALDFGSANVLAFRAAYPKGINPRVVAPDDAARAGVDVVMMARIATDPAWLAWLALASNTDVKEYVAMSEFSDEETLAKLAATFGPPVDVDGVTVDPYAAVREAALRNPRVGARALHAAAPTASRDEAASIRANPSADAEVLALLPS